MKVFLQAAAGVIAGGVAVAMMYLGLMGLAAWWAERE